MTAPIDRADLAADADRLSAAKLGLLLLSLDAVASRARELIPEFHDPERVKDGARACAAWWANPRANRSGPYDAIITALAEALERIGDRADAPSVASWLGRFTSAISVQSVINDWSVLLTRFTPEYGSALRQLGLPSAATVLLGRVASEYTARADSIDAFNEALEADMRSSAWDRAHLAQYQEESDLISPTDYLWGWMQAEAVLGALRIIVEQFNDGELRLFEAWAKSVAEVELRIPASRFSLASVRQLLSAGRAPASGARSDGGA